MGTSTQPCTTLRWAKRALLHTYLHRQILSAPVCTRLCHRADVTTTTKPPHHARGRHRGFPVSTSCCELAPSWEPGGCFLLDPGPHRGVGRPRRREHPGAPPLPRRLEPTDSGTTWALAHMEPPTLLSTCRERPVASWGLASEPPGPWGAARSGVRGKGQAHSKYRVEAPYMSNG